MQGVDLKHSIITTNKFNEAAEFIHYIWTNDLNLIPQELRDIKGVEVRLISELASFRLFKEISLSSNIKESSSKPGNIIRIILLREFGGIYHDLDYYLFSPKQLVRITKAFNLIAGEESENEYYYIGNAFIASAPNHPVMQEASNLIERNLNNSFSHPEYIQYSYNLFSNHLFKTGPSMLTIAYYKEQNKNGNNDILLPHLFYIIVITYGLLNQNLKLIIKLLTFLPL